MSISTVNYRKTFFPKLDLTRIIGIPTYDALHQINLELKNSALSVKSNLGGATHGNLVIFMINVKYETLSPVLYVRPLHPGIILIPNYATRFASYKLKRVYDKNLQIFHEVHGFEQALIQQVVTPGNEQDIVATKNRTTGQFTGKIHHILHTFSQRMESITKSFEQF